MTSRRKLEEEIARTKDPIVRKQLQELLGKRARRRDKRIEHEKETISQLLRRISSLFWIILIGGYTSIILLVIDWIS